MTKQAEMNTVQSIVLTDFLVGILAVKQGSYNFGVSLHKRASYGISYDTVYYTSPLHCLQMVATH